MYIYNLNKTNNSSLPILDPDYNYDTLYSKENMRDFFKSIQKPEQTTFITGIYIQYHITPYLYEKFQTFTITFINQLKIVFKNILILIMQIYILNVVIVILLLLLI